MILVTVGTHELPFDRLIRAAGRLAQDVDEQVVVQRGTSRVYAGGCVVFDLLAPSKFEELVRAARIVVTHAGPSTIDVAVAAGKPVVVVPRRPELGEHVDDHQVRFTRHLGPPIVVCDDPAELTDVIRRAAAVHRRSTGGRSAIGWSVPDLDAAAAGFAAIVDPLGRASGAPGAPFRGTLSRLDAARRFAWRMLQARTRR